MTGFSEAGCEIISEALQERCWRVLLNLGRIHNCKLGMNTSPRAQHAHNGPKSGLHAICHFQRDNQTRILSPQVETPLSVIHQVPTRRSIRQGKRITTIFHSYPPYRPRVLCDVSHQTMPFFRCIGPINEKFQVGNCADRSLLCSSRGNRRMNTYSKSPLLFVGRAPIRHKPTGHAGRNLSLRSFAT